MKCPKGWKPPSDDVRKAPGTLLAEISIDGRAVPWSVPPKLRRKEPRLVAWQELVALRARVAMGNRLPYSGPVRIEFRFVLSGADDRGRELPSPDLTNMQKSTEDALQEIVIANDRQVRSVESDVEFIPPDPPFRDVDFCLVRVIAL